MMDPLEIVVPKSLVLISNRIYGGVILQRLWGLVKKDQTTSSGATNV